MKKYNSSALSNNRSEVLEEAAENGVIIQEKATNGKVRREFLLTSYIENDLGMSAQNALVDRLVNIMEDDLSSYLDRNGVLLTDPQKILNKSLSKMADNAGVAPQRYSFDKQSVSESEFMAAKTRMALEQKVTK